MSYSSNTIFLRKLIIDVSVLSVISVPLANISSWIAPFERGFFCDDNSIRYPYYPSTVSKESLWSTGFTVSFFIIILTEFLRRKSTATKLTLFGFDIPAWLVSTYEICLVFSFGFVSQNLTLDVIKLQIGKLRPNFIAVCQPDVNCTLNENKHLYIQNFTCLAGDHKAVLEARMSFPSGHTGFCSYIVIFICFYVQQRFTWSGSILLKHLVQLLLILAASFTVISRLSDYKHHYVDVIGGFFVGFIFSILTLKFILKFESETNQKGTNFEMNFRGTNISNAT